MADIISQLNLTEQELKENEKVLKEIVKTIDKIENSKGINITDSIVKEFNTDRNLIKNMKDELEYALNSLKISFGVDIVIDDKLAKQINEKMQKQFGKGPDSGLYENIKFQYEDVDLNGAIFKNMGISSPKFNELRGKGYEIVNEEEKAQKAQTEVVDKAVEERNRLMEEGRRRAAENAKKDQSAGTWTPEELKVMSGEIEELKKYKKLLEDTKNFNFDAYNKSILTDVSLDSKIKEVDDLINKMRELKSTGKDDKITKLFTNFTNNAEYKDYTNALYELNADAIKGDVKDSIKNVQNEILDLVNSIADIKIEGDKVTKFEWALELAEELRTDTGLLEEFKQRLIDVYKTYYSSSNSIKMLTEFGNFRSPNEIYRGFTISEKDKSEDVLEAETNKEFFESLFNNEEEFKKYIEDYKKLDEEIKKINNNKKLTDDEKTEQINNLIGKSGIDIDSVKEYIKAINQINRFESYQGKEVNGTSAVLEKLKNDKDEMEKSRSLLEFIIGTGGDDTKNVKSYLRFGKPLAENVDLVDREKIKVNENITKQEQDSIKSSEEYQKSISNEQNRIEELINVLNRLQEVQKSETQLNRDLSVDAQVNLWNQDLETISKAENEIDSLASKINKVHNEGLLNTTQLDILPQDLLNIKTVLSTNYGAGFDKDTLDRVESIREKYNEIRQIKDNIIDDTRSEAGQEELIAKIVNSITKANKEREEAQKKFNSNRGQYEISLEENRKLVEGYTNSIERLTPIYNEFQKKYKEGLKASGKIDDTNINTLTEKYGYDLYKRIGLDKLTEEKKKAQNEIDKIQDIYFKAGEKLPKQQNRNEDLLGLNTYADNLIRVERINEMRQSISDKLNSSEAKGIDKLKEKMEEYKKQLQSLDAPGIDKIIEKLEIYQKEFDNAIKKGDIARAKNVFGYFEQQFSPVKSIQNGQRIATNKRVDTEKAEQEAAKAQAEASNNYTNKKKLEAKTIDNIKSKMYEYNQQLDHTDTKGLDKVIEKLGIYNRELDKAIQKNDIVRASNIFSLYENQFGSIAGIKKGQQIASNEEAKRQAELAKEQAKADSDAAKAADEREKVLREEQTIRSKIAEMQSKEQAKADSDVNKKLEEREKVLREEQTIREKIAEIQSKEEAKAADEREKVLREEQAIREKIAEMQSKNQVKEDSDATKQWEEQVNRLRNKISEVTNYIKQAIANTVKVIRAANNVVNKSISVMIGAFDKLGSAIQRVIQLFGNLGNRVTGFNKQGNILKGTYTELKSKIDLLVGAFNKLYNNNFINEGKKLLSSVQTLNMLIGTELTTKTMEWANNLEHAFGLSAAGLISDLKELTAVMYGLGMSSKDVQIATTNLEAVAMSLSATTGYEFSTVVNKIQSGMKGMT